MRVKALFYYLLSCFLHARAGLYDLYNTHCSLLQLYVQVFLGTTTSICASIVWAVFSVHGCLKMPLLLDFD
jgi:hypothetical protein